LGRRESSNYGELRWILSGVCAVTPLGIEGHCGHALVFVTSPGGAWFAVSNPGEDEEADD